jgi:Holliday junction DNA helicase RuvA
VNGVGYKIEMGDIDMLVGQEASLYIHTHVREQELRLFGFKKSQELDLFERLLDVSGVGPRGAMAILSNIGFEKILNAIESENPHGLKAPGIGIKTAQKILLELKGKLGNTSAGKRYSGTVLQMIEDAIGALEGLGYRRYEVDEQIAQIKIEESWQSEDIIRVLLRRLQTEVKKR